MNGFGFGGRGSMPPVTLNLIIINFLIWIVEFAFPSMGNTIIRILGLHYIGSPTFNPIQIVTYMFVHAQGNLMHIIFNMFTLWMFGRLLEQVWGSKRYLIFYFICGIGAALIQEGVWALSWYHDYVAGIAPLNGRTYDSMNAIVQNAIASGDTEIIHAMEAFKASLITIGASGAVFGLLLGFAFVFPNLPLYLFFIPIPIKAKYMVIGYGVLEFFLGIAGRMDSVAHFAHLGGMLFGLILLLYWKKKGMLGGGSFY